MKGSILVATHYPHKLSSGAGETDCPISLAIAVRNASKIPGPGVIVALYDARIPSAALDPHFAFWR